MGLGAGEGWDATGFVLSDGAAPPDIGAEDRGRRRSQGQWHHLPWSSHAGTLGWPFTEVKVAKIRHMKL